MNSNYAMSRVDKLSKTCYILVQILSPWRTFFQARIIVYWWYSKLKARRFIDIFKLKGAVQSLKALLWKLKLFVFYHKSCKSFKASTNDSIELTTSCSFWSYLDLLLCKRALQKPRLTWTNHILWPHVIFKITALAIQLTKMITLEYDTYCQPRMVKGLLLGIESPLCIVHSTALQVTSQNLGILVIALVIPDEYILMN